MSTQTTTFHPKESSYLQYIKDNHQLKVIAIGVSSSLLKNKVILFLKENNLLGQLIDNYQSINEQKKGIFIAHLRLNNSFIINNIIFVPDKLLIGKEIPIYDSITKNNNINFKKLNLLEKGCYVVHKQYGIGKFEDIDLITSGSITKECIKIIYAENSALYLPIENIDQISKYKQVTEENNSVVLDSLKSKLWQNRKAKTESKIQKLAYDIIKIASERKLLLGEIYSRESRQDMVNKIEKSFNYIETEDQIKAIEAIYEDLSSGKIMNRLLCGDVGFGKTEVAIRAAFLVVCGKICSKNYSQVVILCPAVFLAAQHYENICKRFSEFNIKVELLSRFVPAKKAFQIKQELANGQIDVIIGTHALLQDNIEFKNLGLIICDEEQSFGVAHKEKLKALSPKTHILTITATPIPRTLQSALYGITDISVLSTAPFGRNIIKTEIITFLKQEIHDILLHEKQCGGQTIIITPRIADIAEINDKISNIMPSLRIGIMHGSLSEKEMDHIMDIFYNGAYDIIIATTIIATGMDFGNSNTIIINKPEMFGLSQLYQIRGRVGRRDKQAYCYLLTDERNILDKDKMRRLSMLQAFNYSGSSLAISNSDLDIRGGGNLLGKDQSGIISDIGPELYYDLLNEAINSLDGKQNKKYEVNIDIGKSIYIPKEYISDATTRIEFYRKIGAIESSYDVLNLKAEMMDRFGSLPDVIENLFEIANIKQLCYKYKISNLKLTNNKLKIKFFSDLDINIDNLINLFSKDKNYKPCPDNSIEISHNLNISNIIQLDKLRLIIEKLVF